MAFPAFALLFLSGFLLGECYPQNSQGFIDQSTFQIGQGVQTSSGLIVGHAAKTATDVSEYLGIPFAQAPVGDLRFAAPQPYTGNCPITAANYAPDCPANTLNPSEAGPSLLSLLAGSNSIQLLEELGQVGNQQSEDCLFLNIWTKPQTGETSKAVLFWIYGGGFNTGSTNDPSYDGEFFADAQDVVVVSANYRLNVFGFPGLPGASISQNPGLLDQRLAVEWVQKNIAAFGGDPNRITLFGQSAGAASVDFYTYAWTEDPIANAFIAESGTSTAFTNPTPLNNTAAWFNASTQLRCGGESVGVEQSIACVRTKNFTDVLAATAVSSPLQAVLGEFGPTVDEQVVFSDYDVRGPAGDFIQRPYFIGNNNYEAGVFRILATVGGVNISDIEWCLFDLVIFTCPVGQAASYRALRVPTYRYRYYADFPNLRLTLNPPSGPYHGSEIAVVWGTAEQASGVADTAPEQSISNFLQGAWASFAKNPETALASAPYRFPQYNQLTPSLIQFTVNNETQPFFVSPTLTDTFCPTLEALSALIPGGLTSVVTSGGGSLGSLGSIPGISSIPGIANLTSIVTQFLDVPLPVPDQCPF